MICTKFEAAKLRNELRRTGREVTFLRPAVDEYGQPVPNEFDEILSVVVLYHESNSNIHITTGDTTQVRNKKIPMLLCLYNSVVGDDGKLIVKPNDIVILNDKRFEVQGLENIQEWNIIVDISLGVIDIGS